MSVTLQSVLGEGTEGSTCFINLLIDKMRINLSVWNSEPDVVKETLDTLIALVSRTKRYVKSIVQEENFHRILIFAILLMANKLNFNSAYYIFRNLSVMAYIIEYKKIKIR